ncbi:hypothetical protein M5X11_05730 [Paenibacillus alginolyticus]|nr:hypothetical protein [Paenibacillus alginolyticus]
MIQKLLELDAAAILIGFDKLQDQFRCNKSKFRTAHT